MNKKDLYFDNELEKLIAYEELDEALLDLFDIFYKDVFEPISRITYKALEKIGVIK